MTLFEKMRDLKIRLQIWIFVWAGAMLTGPLAVFFYLKPSPGLGWLWERFQLIQLLEMVGLGGYPSLQPSTLHPMISFTILHEHLPENVYNDLITKWMHDFHILIQTPMYTTAVVILAYFIFSNPENGEQK